MHRFCPRVQRWAVGGLRQIHGDDGESKANTDMGEG
jgi:hypothetical protein